MTPGFSVDDYEYGVRFTSDRQLDHETAMAALIMQALSSLSPAATKRLTAYLAARFADGGT